MGEKDLDRQDLPFLTSEEVLEIGEKCKGEGSPVNLSFDVMKEVRLSPLDWENFSVTPKHMKISNSGLTAILSGKWDGKRPYIANGPVSGKYVFSQLHFHWGRTFEEGSEHTIDNEGLPMEAHAMFFKNMYASQDEAMKKIDGTVTIAFFFKLQEEDNPDLGPVVETLPKLTEAMSWETIQPVPLATLVPSFNSDYFLYWGSIQPMSVLWIISRAPIGISKDQLAAFKLLTDPKRNPIEMNFRLVRELNHRVIYHVNPSKDKHDILLPLKSKENLIRDRSDGDGIHEEPKTNPEKAVQEIPVGDQLWNSKKLNPVLESLHDLFESGQNKKDLRITLAKALLELEKNEGTSSGELEKFIRSKYLNELDDEPSYIEPREKGAQEEIEVACIRSDRDVMSPDKNKWKDKKEHQIMRRKVRSILSGKAKSAKGNSQIPKYRQSRLQKVAGKCEYEKVDNLKDDTKDVEVERPLSEGHAVEEKKRIHFADEVGKSEVFEFLPRKRSSLLLASNVSVVTKKSEERLEVRKEHPRELSRREARECEREKMREKISEIMGRLREERFGRIGQKTSTPKKQWKP